MTFIKLISGCLPDALRDSALILPVLLPVYFLIEWVEYKKYAHLESSPLLCGKFSPIIGALFGSIPQCGFSVAATDLFAKGSLSVGALVAVYIATSDEAVPILLSRPDRISDLLLLVGAKLILGIIAGYLAMLFIKKSSSHAGSHEHPHNEGAHGEHHASVGCCSHEIEGGEKFDWKHPLVHCLKIFLYVLAVNIIMGVIIAGVGEDSITAFLSGSKWLQPLFAVLVGLIPNCASSVVLTELYLLDGLTFGAVIAGLSVNAGLGFMVLYKENKNPAENIKITAAVLLFGLAAGYAATASGLF